MAGLVLDAEAAQGGCFCVESSATEVPLKHLAEALASIAPPAIGCSVGVVICAVEFILVFAFGVGHVVFSLSV